MSWQDILKRRGREIKANRKKTGSVNTGWSKPKIKTDNDIKVEYIDEMIGVVKSVSHTEGNEGEAYREPKYGVHNLYFDMNKLGGRLLNEWFLEILNTLKKGLKQNKPIELKWSGRVDLYTLEKFKELVHGLMKYVNPPHYHYLEMEDLREPFIVNVGDETISIDFDLSGLRDKQLASKEKNRKKSVPKIIKLAQDNMNKFDEFTKEQVNYAIEDLENKYDREAFEGLMYILMKKGLLDTF